MSIFVTARSLSQNSSPPSIASSYGSVAVPTLVGAAWAAAAGNKIASDAATVATRIDRRVINGETGIRTRDTTIFSRVLYQLSYLAAPGDGTGTVRSAMNPEWLWM